MEFQCRGDCPASLHLLLFVCGKHSAPSRTPFRQATKTVRLPTGIGVHLQTGMLFGITTESCSASQRNRVHLRPDSPMFTLHPSSIKTNKGTLTPSSRRRLLRHHRNHRHFLCRRLRLPLRLLPRRAVVERGHRQTDQKGLSRGILDVFCSCPMVRLV